ncbi:PREDICTED: cytochrome P450 4V2-like [Nicrophorus vespilloides]|uniref:Cytochrome P450 4V2-like n=1 Tax=Nicrophorus vespilloides TaxID=110193 RepID=A0ABM1NCS6_NICVS|nr:PREDICTED: cytochrome P450 4V2-like [Nicrophorus vespilloides]
MIVGWEPSLTVSNYKTLEIILNSTKLSHKATPYRYFHNWLGQGLLTSSGDKWRKRRKIITPAYHFKILEQFVNVFDKVSDILVNEVRRECNKQSFDIYPYITLCALDIICETAMGISVNAQVNKNSEYVQSVKKMCKIVMDRTFSPLQYFDILYRFTKNYRDEKRCLKVLNEYNFEIIRKRRQELKSRGNEKESENFEKKKVAFLDMLLQAKIDEQPLSDEDIREEVATFMFEGHDTTASAMSFALFELAKNVEVQNKVFDEQKCLFADFPERSVTYKDLNDMKYLELVLKETLRLYPSVPFYARQTMEEINLTNDIKLPKGFIINIFAYGIHRDPQFYPDPDSFDPERFSHDNNTGKYPYSFIPFSAGLRNCIGQKFALLEMKATISKFIRKYELLPRHPEHHLQLISETILKSANGVYIKLIDRKWQ